MHFVATLMERHRTEGHILFSAERKELIAVKKFASPRINVKTALSNSKMALA
jgi:hypothetical protein